MGGLRLKRPLPRPSGWGLDFCTKRSVPVPSIALGASADGATRRYRVKARMGRLPADGPTSNRSVTLRLDGASVGAGLVEPSRMR